MGIRITDMKFLVVFLLLFSDQVIADHFIFGPDQTVINGRSNASAVKPGDTIFLSGNPCSAPINKTKA